MQRTLAIELQKLSVQFRKQQKAYLNKLRKTSAASSSFSLLDETGPTARVDEEYDPGFSEIQVCALSAGLNSQSLSWRGGTVREKLLPTRQHLKPEKAKAFDTMLGCGLLHARRCQEKCYCGQEHLQPRVSLCHVQTLRVDTMDAFAQERDREVRNILQSINDLAQIMKDLSVLVIDQGTIVDRIDYNMEQVRP